MDPDAASLIVRSEALRMPQDPQRRPHVHRNCSIPSRLTNKFDVENITYTTQANDHADESLWLHTVGSSRAPGREGKSTGIAIKR